MINNIQKIYSLVEKNDALTQEFFQMLKDGEEISLIDDELRVIGLALTKENRYALTTRLCSLRDDALVQVLEQNGHIGVELEKIKMEVYHWVSRYYLNRHQNMLNEIKESSLLSPFYMNLLEGVHNVGVAMTDFHVKWYWHIMVEINPSLSDEFGSAENVMKFLRDNNLLDKDEDSKLADRCYSVLVKVNNKYKSVSYAEAFEEEVSAIVTAIAQTLASISSYEDEEFFQKDSYSKYLARLMGAFVERDTTKTLSVWADVDRAWMDVKGVIQIGHPLEYYEDHYRKAVAPEWDVRLVNPAQQSKNVRAISIEKMFNTMHSELKAPKKLKDTVVNNIRRTQLYLGRPALYYAAEFNGLFSAQVVPNDENVSSELGKKIFAFADMVLQSSKAKPVMKISSLVLGKDFVDSRRSLMFNKPELWHHLYDIETIGHEFGHILWVDENSEATMNSSAQFKNVEEFKATAGGLISFFHSEEKELTKELTRSIISRAVGLIAWMQTDEVQPYYCEGLIHLNGLFDSGVLKFNSEKLSLDLEAYDNLKEWYLKTYSELAIHYIEKKDSKEFLDKFTIYVEGNFMPRNDIVRSFVQYYWNLHQKIGREIDEG